MDPSKVSAQEYDISELILTLYQRFMARFPSLHDLRVWKRDFVCAGEFSSAAAKSRASKESVSLGFDSDGRFSAISLVCTRQWRLMVQPW